MVPKYKPKFYPVLPRNPLGKTKRSAETRSKTNEPVYVWKMYKADRYTKSTGLYEPNFLVSSSRTQVATNTRSFINNPGWKQAIAKGQDAGATYSRQLNSWIPCRFSGVNESSNVRSVFVGQVHGGENLLEHEWQSLIDQATARLKHRLDGNIGKAQLAAPLAESREIHRLVRQINTLGIDMTKALLAVRKTRGRSLLKQFGNIWLGFGFGVNPLLKDIESAANSILDYTTREDRQVRARGTASREYQTSLKILYGEDVAHGLQLGGNVRVHHTQGVRIVAGLNLNLRSSASYSVTDHLGLKVTELPSVAWELTPFSWVFDYFVTVGPWLDDMFYTLPGVTKYIYQTQKYQSLAETDLYPIPSSGFRTAFNQSTGTAKHVGYGRSRLTALSSRPIRIKSADEIANNGLTKLLNLGSVLAQKYGGPSLELKQRGFTPSYFHVGNS